MNDMETAQAEPSLAMEPQMSRMDERTYRRIFAEKMNEFYGIPVPDDLWPMVDDARKLDMDPEVFVARVGDAYGLELLPSAKRRGVSLRFH